MNNELQTAPMPHILEAQQIPSPSHIEGSDVLSEVQEQAALLEANGFTNLSQEIESIVWKETLRPLLLRRRLLELLIAGNERSRQFKNAQLLQSIQESSDFKEALREVVDNPNTPAEYAEAGQEILRQSEQIQIVEPNRLEYIISVPKGFQLLSTSEVGTNLDDLKAAGIIDILDAPEGTSERLVSMTMPDAIRLQAEMPGLIVAPNTLYELISHPQIHDFGEESLHWLGRTRKIKIRITDQQSGTGVPDVSIHFITPGTTKGRRATTDASGECEVSVSAKQKSFDIYILPKDNHWKKQFNNQDVGDRFEMSLQPLFPEKGDCYDWGHKYAGMDMLQSPLVSEGKKVRIGVIDSGVFSHSRLPVAGGRNCMVSEPTYRYDEDYIGHGSHVAGIISAQATGRGMLGYIPEAEIYSYRVFGKKKFVYAYDITTAIGQAIKDGCDLINFSLGNSNQDPSENDLLLNKIEEAYHKGIVCIAATGNSGQGVLFPAGFSIVLGVGAFGKFESYPPNSIHKNYEINAVKSHTGQYYVPAFSNYGQGVNYIAPGVAITSTIPANGYSAWDGTSMACPHVTGIAALALAMNPGILNDRTPARIRALIDILNDIAEPLGVGSEREGLGCLRVSNLIARHHRAN